MSDSWKAGDVILGQHEFHPIAMSIGFGQSDEDSWTNIMEVFQKRNVRTVSDILSWSGDEITGLLLTLKKGEKITKSPRTYLNLIGVKLGASFSNISDEVKVVDGQGADWLSHCTKPKASSDFNTSTFTPDGRVFASLPRRGSAKFLLPQQEKLYLDLLWLCGQAHPDSSWGDYLPPGLTGRLEEVSNTMLPDLRPLASTSAKPSARRYKKTITLRFQNGRNGVGQMKRMVLDENLKEYITERCRPRVKFVPATSEQLIKNERNRIFAELIKVYRKELPVSFARVTPCRMLAQASLH